MSDRYAAARQHPGRRLVARSVGLPQPGRARALRARATPVVAGAGAASAPRPAAGSSEPARAGSARRSSADRGAERGGATEARRALKALVFDATGIADSTAARRAARASSTRRSAASRRSGRVVVLGTPPAERRRRREATAQRALEGFTRSLGKEVAARRDRAARLRRARRRGPARVDAALPALAALGLRLGPGRARSATGGGAAAELDWERPLAGKVALVTGASRGIGAAIAATLARDGAHVVGLDVPPLARRPRAR